MIGILYLDLQLPQSPTNHQTQTRGARRPHTRNTQQRRPERPHLEADVLTFTEEHELFRTTVRDVVRNEIVAGIVVSAL